MSKSTALVSGGLSTSLFLPPTLTFAVVSLHPLTGKSSLCKRLTDPNFDHYRSFVFKCKSTDHPQQANWFYWGSVKHRRSDEKREALFHFIEHSSLAIDENENYDNYFKRITTLTFRAEEKFSANNDFPQSRAFPKEKVIIDGFLCLHDLSSNKQISDLLFLLHGLFKTRRPVFLITTKNDAIENQSEMATLFEQSIRRSQSNDAQYLTNIPILHTSANEYVNIQSIFELALFFFDDPHSQTSRKHSNALNISSKYLPPSYDEAFRNEQSIKQAIISEFRSLLKRYVTEIKETSWTKFLNTWLHHTTVKNALDLLGKQHTERLFHEHIDELKRLTRKKLIDQRLIPILELLITDPKTKSSR